MWVGEEEEVVPFARSFINFLFHEFNLSVDFYPRDHLSACGAGVKEGRRKRRRRGRGGEGLC